jgi:ribosomal-protein-alanine N-acetyltransferase
VVGRTKADKSAVLIDLGEVMIRNLRGKDAPSLARNANNPRVAANLRDRFPQPYTVKDAREWIRRIRSASPETGFAIADGDEVVGGIGYMPQIDVARLSAEIGYWLAEPYWGKGIATRAVRAFVKHVFATTDLVRLYAYVFETNPASVRVLEKAGFRREGRLRKSVIKHGRIIDQDLFALLRDEAP